MKTIKKISFLSDNSNSSLFKIKSWFDTWTPDYFIKTNPTEWELIKNMSFFSKKYKYLLNNLKKIGKTIFLCNYVYRKQQIVRVILFKLEKYLTERTNLIFNSNISEDELINESIDLNNLYDNIYSGGSVGGSGSQSDFTTIEDPSLYAPSALITGPSNYDFDKIKYVNIGFFKKLKTKITTKIKELFKRKHSKREELDILYNKILKYKKKLLGAILPLLKGQRNLYIYYHRTRILNNKDMVNKFKGSFYIGSDEKRIKSLGMNKQKKLDKFKERETIYNAIEQYWKNLDDDYGKIVNMYEKNIKGFWLQDKYGRVVSRFYAKEDYKFGRAFLDLINKINEKVYIDQITYNILGELYKKLSKTITLEDSSHPTYFEVRMIAHEKKCYSRILTQTYVWSLLMKSQGFNINIDGILTEPNKKFIEIKVGQSPATSLIDKMVLSDQLLTYYEYASGDTRNFIGWQNSKEGLHGFMSFFSLLGIYDKDV